MRAKKPSIDEQFSRFVVMIQQVNISVPLMDAMKVPTYARYIKDIINNKRPLPTTEVISSLRHVVQLYFNNCPRRRRI